MGQAASTEEGEDDHRHRGHLFRHPGSKTTLTLTDREIEQIAAQWDIKGPLQSELIALQVAFDEYIASSQEMRKEIDADLDRMHFKLAESTAANRSLSDQLEKLSPQLSGLESALAESRQSMKHVHKECEAVKQQRLELELEKDRLQKELDQAHIRLTQAEATTPSFFRRQIESIGTTIKSAIPNPINAIPIGKGSETAKEEGESAEHQSENVAHLEQSDPKELENLAKVNEELLLARKEIASVKEELRLSEEERNALELELEEAQSRHREDVDALTSQVNEAEEASKTSLEEAALATANLETANTELEELKQEIEAIRIEHANSQKALAKIKDELSMAQEGVALTQQMLQASEEEGNELKQALEEEKVRHREDVNMLTIQINEAEVTIKTLTEKATLVEDVKAENEELKHEVERLQTEISLAQEKHEALQLSLEEEQAKHCEEVTRLTSLVKEAEVASETSIGNAASIAAAAEEARTENEELKRTIASLEAELERINQAKPLEEDLAKVREELAQAKTEIASAEEQRKALELALEEERTKHLDKHATRETSQIEEADVACKSSSGEVSPEADSIRIANIAEVEELKRTIASLEAELERINQAHQCSTEEPESVNARPEQACNLARKDGQDSAMQESFNKMKVDSEQQGESSDNLGSSESLQKLLEEDLAKVREELSQAKIEIASAQDERKVLELALEEERAKHLDKHVTREATQIEEADVACKSSSGEVSPEADSNRIANIAELEELKRTIASLEAELERINHAHQGSAAELESVNAQLEQACNEARKEGQDSAMQELLNKMKVDSEQQGESSDNLSSSESLQKLLEEDLAKVRKELSQAKIEIASAEEERKALELALEEERTKDRDDVSKVESQIEEAEIHSQKALPEADSVQTTITENAENAELKLEVAQLQTEITNRIESERKLMETVQKVNDELSLVRKELALAQGELESLKIAFEKEEIQHREAVTMLANQVNDSEVVSKITPEESGSQLEETRQETQIEGHDSANSEQEVSPDSLKSSERLQIPFEDDFANVSQELLLAKTKIASAEDELRAVELALEQERSTHHDDVARLTSLVSEAEVASKTSLRDVALLATSLEAIKAENEELKREITKHRTENANTLERETKLAEDLGNGTETKLAEDLGNGTKEHSLTEKHVVSSEGEQTLFNSALEDEDAKNSEGVIKLASKVNEANVASEKSPPDEAQTVVEGLQQKLAALQAENSNLLEMEQRLKEDLAQVNEELSRAKTEIISTQERLNLSEQERKELEVALEEELNKLTIQMKETEVASKNSVERATIENEELRVEIEKLRIENANRLESEQNLSMNLARVREELSLAQEGISLTRQMLQSSEDERQELERTLEEELTKLTMQFNEAEVAHKMALACAEGANTENEELKRKIASLEEDRKELELTLEEELTKLSIQFQEAEVAHKTALASAEGAKTESEELKRRIFSLEAERKELEVTLEEELTKLSIQFQEAEVAHKTALSIAEMANAENEELKRRVFSVENERKELELTLEEELTKLSIQFQEADVAQKTSLSIAERANAENQELKNQIASLEAALTKAKQDNDGIIAEMESLMDEACNEARKEGRDSAMEELRETMKADAAKEVSTIKQHLVVLSQENIGLQQKIDETETELASMKARQDDRNLEESNALKELQEELTRVKDELSRKNAEMATLTTSMEDRLMRAEERASKVENSRPSSPSSVTKLEYRLQEEEKKNVDLQRQYNQLQEQKLIAEERILRLEDDLQLLHKQLATGKLKNVPAGVELASPRMSSLKSSSTHSAKEPRTPQLSSKKNSSTHSAKVPRTPKVRLDPDGSVGPGDGIKSDKRKNQASGSNVDGQVGFGQAMSPDSVSSGRARPRKPVDGKDVKPPQSASRGGPMGKGSRHQRK